MFAELPKLFDRNFAVGYLLPVVVAATACLGLLHAVDLLPDSLTKLASTDLVVGGTAAGFGLWLAAVVLLATNRGLIRLLEGYGWCNPARLFSCIERNRYHALRLELDQLKIERQTAKDALGLADRRIRAHEKKAERFPDNEAFLLATAFGNTVRAFEVYSRVAYGLDAVAGWSRLLAVVPKDFRRLLDDAKAQVDFWVNLWFLTLLASPLPCAIAVWQHSWKLGWLTVAALLFAWLSAARARNGALDWGDLVKAAFDVYRVDLCHKLGYRLPISQKEERAFWEACTQLFAYRNPKRLESFDHLRELTVATAATSALPGSPTTPPVDE